MERIVFETTQTGGSIRILHVAAWYAPNPEPPEPCDAAIGYAVIDTEADGGPARLFEGEMKYASNEVTYPQITDVRDDLTDYIQKAHGLALNPWTVSKTDPAVYLD